jgi:predicted lipid-binding transport protein (Tim44 family)
MSSFAVQPSRRTGLLGRRLAVLGLVGVLAMGALTPMDAEARRMGGSRSIGRQSQMAPSQSPSSTGQPQRAQQAQPAQQTPPAAAAAAQPRNRWMGPLAGLAAGLGIAALLSQFGLGAGLAQMMSNFLLIALVVFAGVALFRFIQRRRRPQLAYPQNGATPRDGDFSRPSQYAAQQPTPAYTAPGVTATGMGAAASVTNLNAPKPGSVPAGFDREAFTREAKVSFIRLQAAWDKGDQGDIFEFTTPEMFAEVKMDLESRSGQSNRTDVVQLEAELLGVEERGSEQLASVRFHGLIRESEHEAAQSFEEVWNFVKDTRNEPIWRLAGIQQLA